MYKNIILYSFVFHFCKFKKEGISVIYKVIGTNIKYSIKCMREASA